MAYLNGIQQALECKPSVFLEELIVKLKEESDSVKIYWYQHSQCKWISFGYRNNRYFHTVTNICKKKRYIKGLPNGLGYWCTDQQTIKQLAAKFFEDLYT